MADDINEDLGKPGFRNPAAFKATLLALKDRIVTMRRSWTGRAGRVIRVLADASGPGDEGPVDFAQDPLSGGLLTHLLMDAGNQTIAATLSGRELTSESATDVTWTYSGLAPVGTLLGWVQAGAGEITFAVNNSGEISNPDGHTKSGGPDSCGVMRVIRLNGSGRAVWKLLGETQD